MTLLNLEARRAAIVDAVAIYQSLNSKPTLTLRWRNEQQTFPVVRLPIDAVVLNHLSRRIRSQLESHPDASLVSAEPYGERAQEVIASLLKKDPTDPSKTDPSYIRLKQNLEEEGQLDAGVVTRSGVLVNANTRCAALRELNEKFINVAVLPDGASPDDVEDLELRLQVRPSLLRDYPFTDQLLLVHDLMEQRRLSEADIAKMIGRQPKTVARMRRVLLNVRDLQKSSTIVDKAGTQREIPLTWFNDKQQSMEEMDAVVEKMRKSGRTETEIQHVFQTRTVAMLAGRTKLDLRRVTTGFTAEHLIDNLANTALASVVADTEPVPLPPQVKIPGLGFDVPGEDAPSSLPRMADLVGCAAKAVAATYHGVDVEVATPKGALQADQVRAELKTAMGNAMDTAEQSDRRTDELEQPSVILDEVLLKLQQLRSAIARVVDDEDFDSDALAAPLAEAQRALDRVSNGLQQAEQA